MLRTLTLILAGGLLHVTGASALERVSVRADRAAAEGWDAGGSCTVTYANTCTGWLWVWSNWADHEIVGVVFDPCCAQANLIATQTYFWDRAIPAYGYTGTIAVSSVSGDCLGTRYAARPFLPPEGATVLSWEGIPSGPVALTFTNGVGEGYDHGIWTLPTDHPAAGPTGPQACGTCFPSSRVTHTFRFGTVESPLCPGQRFNDGVCDAEALHWSAAFSCPTVSAKETTWGSLKGLYR